MTTNFKDINCPKCGNRNIKGHLCDHKLPSVEGTPYHEIDHNHCWQDKNPPCGQKIEHAKCCLCGKVNPKYVPRDAVLEVIEGCKRFGYDRDHISRSQLKARITELFDNK